MPSAMPGVPKVRLDRLRVLHPPRRPSEAHSHGLRADARGDVAAVRRPVVPRAAQQVTAY